jgi:hypothetical protein
MTSTPDESFTVMEGRDLEAIGAHCQMEYCHVLDFLPFRCESCRGYMHPKTTHHIPPSPN